MNTQIARTNMVKQQLRTNGVLNDALLGIINTTPRELFVPPLYHKLAYADMTIPLPHGQVMLSPMMEARLLQALAIQPHETVLEVGTGTGYLTALLAQLAQHVTSVDAYPDFTVTATEHLAQLAITNATLYTGNAAQGWQSPQPFDVIVITGALPFLPQAFETQLAEGGRLFAFIGEKPVIEAHLLTRVQGQAWQDEMLFETVVPPLISLLQHEDFEF